MTAEISVILVRRGTARRSEGDVDERVRVELLERFDLPRRLVDLLLRRPGRLQFLDLLVEDVVRDPRGAVVNHLPGRDVARGGDERDQYPRSLSTTLRSARPVE